MAQRGPRFAISCRRSLSHCAFPRPSRKFCFHSGLGITSIRSFSGSRARVLARRVFLFASISRVVGRRLYSARTPWGERLGQRRSTDSAAGFKKRGRRYSEGCCTGGPRLCARGNREDVSRNLLAVKVSIHAPARRATCQFLVWMPSFHMFQSTPLHEGRQRLCRDRRGKGSFDPPARGATPLVRRQHGPLGASIHALRERRLVRRSTS